MTNQQDAMIFADNCLALVIDRYRRKGWDLPPRSRRALIRGAIANVMESELAEPTCDEFRRLRAEVQRLQDELGQAQRAVVDLITKLDLYTDEILDDTHRDLLDDYCADAIVRLRSWAMPSTIAQAEQ